MRVSIVAVLMMAAACSPDPSPEEQRKLDEQAIAEVEAHQVPPPERVVPQAMQFADFEANGIFGVGCSFRPEGGAEDPIAVTLIKAGYMKIDDEIERFAPDAGSAESAFGTRVKYDGARRSMRLELLEDEGEPIGMETVGYDARLTVRDGRDQVVYRADGRAECGS